MNHTTSTAVFGLTCEKKKKSWPSTISAPTKLEETVVKTKRKENHKTGMNEGRITKKKKEKLAKEAGDDLVDAIAEFFIEITGSYKRHNSWENSEKGASKSVPVFHMFNNVMGGGGARPPLLRLLFTSAAPNQTIRTLLP